MYENIIFLINKEKIRSTQEKQTKAHYYAPKQPISRPSPHHMIFFFFLKKKNEAHYKRLGQLCQSRPIHLLGRSNKPSAGPVQPYKGSKNLTKSE